MKSEIFEETVLFWLGPVPVTAVMASTLVTSIVLIAVGRSAARAVRSAPESAMAAAARLGFRFLTDLAREAAGRPWPALEVFAGSLFLFIATGALLGQLPGVPTPTSSLPTTVALALMVFFAVPIVGIRAKGLRGYLVHYLQPNPLLFPLHVVSELSRTLALALRLFGNMMSGHLVVALIVALVGFFVPVPLMALDLLIGFLQAYIFAILTCVYLGAAVRVGEG